jgi:hypothetical protein
VKPFSFFQKPKQFWRKQFPFSENQISFGRKSLGFQKTKTVLEEKVSVFRKPKQFWPKLFRFLRFCKCFSEKENFFPETVLDQILSKVFSFLRNCFFAKKRILFALMVCYGAFASEWKTLTAGFVGCSSK